MLDPAGITAHGLGKTYRSGVVALIEVDLEVPYGEMLALLGRNGSGKTTTVRILTTLTRPTVGTASVGGYDVQTAAADVRRAVGVTMQDAALDPSMTAREHLRLVAALSGLGRADARARTDELLDQFGLSDAADRCSGEFSGGMRRRLDLAGALVARPSVLFLDEPTTGLDAQSRRALWEQIRHLRAQGAAVLLTTQYLEEAEQLADRVAILHTGRVLAQGSPDHLRAGRSTQLRIRISPGSGGPSVPPSGFTGATASHWLNRSVASAAEALYLLDQLRADGIALAAVRIDTPSLEDVYLDVTGRDLTVQVPVVA